MSGYTLLSFILSHEALTRELDLKDEIDQELFGMPSKTFKEAYQERVELIEHCIFEFIESIPRLTGKDVVALMKDSKYILDSLKEKQEIAELFHKNGRSFTEILNSILNFTFEYTPIYKTNYDSEEIYAKVLEKYKIKDEFQKKLHDDAIKYLDQQIKEFEKFNDDIETDDFYMFNGYVNALLDLRIIERREHANFKKRMRELTGKKLPSE